MGAKALDALLELAWPTRCVGCDEPGALLCETCRLELPWIAQRDACPVCGMPYGRLSCTGCRRGMEPSGHAAEAPGASRPRRELTHGERLSEAWPMRCTICALTLEGTAARMATIYKDGHELRLAALMAAAVACALDEASAWDGPDGRPRFAADDLDALCFVPATPAAYARRGFDHMERVARFLSAFTGLPLVDALARDDALDQRSLGRQERQENLASGLSVVDDVAGLRLLLVDDVVTTGSTLGACTRALKGRGAASVTACAFARAW